jgi:PPK2 family polyphosphate:nucleotide phosphotransferase
MNLDSFKSTNKQIRPKQRDIVKYYQQQKVKLKKLQKQLALLQETIQAEKKHAILIVFQAMDAAGKDSTIRNVFRQCDIGGLNNIAFKQPSKEELNHDFLWRCHNKTPAKGNITIFNRSYYEEVLVVKVHPSWLTGQGITHNVNDAFWNKRYKSINNFEQHLHDSGTTIIKFMLDVSQKEQHNRLIRRYSTPSKQWKFSTGDIKESKLWKKYQAAFDEVLCQTSTKIAPWHVIPADDKILMRQIVTEIIISELQKLNPKFPTIPSFTSEDLQLIEQLVKGKI